MRDVFPPTDRGIFSCEGNVLFHWTRFDPVHAPKQLLPLQLLPLQRQTEVVRVLRRPESSTDSRSGRLSRRPDGTFVLRTWCRTLAIGATPQAPENEEAVSKRGCIPARTYGVGAALNPQTRSPNQPLRKSASSVIRMCGTLLPPQGWLAPATARGRGRSRWLYQTISPGPGPVRGSGRRALPRIPPATRIDGRARRTAALASPLLHRRFCAAGAVDMRADVREGRGPRGAQTSK